MRGSDATVRDTTAADLPEVRRLLVATWHDTYDALIGADKVAAVTDRWHAIAVLQRQLEDPALAFLVAAENGRIVGHASVHADRLPTLRLGRLYVLPAAQRRGIGGRLLATAIARYPTARAMQLTVEADNEKGVAFYRKHGFAILEQVREDGIPALRMEKALGL